MNVPKLLFVTRFSISSIVYSLPGAGCKIKKTARNKGLLIYMASKQELSLKWRIIIVRLGAVEF